jgi:protein PhnA
MLDSMLSIHLEFPMSLYENLLGRSHSKCELCSDAKNLSLYEIPPVNKVDENTALIVCQTCLGQIEDPATIDTNHWRCLNDSMWSEFQPVQVMAYRMLSQLRTEIWAQDLLEQLYLDDSILDWAKAGIPEKAEIDSTKPTLDSNGTKLVEGDSVTLIKDLDVKGAGFTAKRGTLVRNIKLTNNPEHIEGKVEGIQIVLISKFLKKV